jgi:hypothetical protein
MLDGRVVVDISSLSKCRTCTRRYVGLESCRAKLQPTSLSEMRAPPRGGVLHLGGVLLRGGRLDLRGGPAAADIAPLDAARNPIPPF